MKILLVEVDAFTRAANAPAQQVQLQIGQAQYLGTRGFGAPAQQGPNTRQQFGKSKGFDQKLEDDPTQPKYFLTETGVGYRFQP